MITVQPSDSFRSNAQKAIFSILVFVITYFLLLGLAIVLVAYCAYLGYLVITSITHIYGVILGIGIASIGILVFIFLVKFIFKSHKIDRTHLIEIKNSDHPVLFQMINDIADKVGTDRPKKVYLSGDVNASVFYDSNFWSMFFPIRKNLQIGVGLVNTVTAKELEAILAHEFGHFSQRSMKVGSYVYNVNQIIYNMLYDNSGFDRLTQSWASINGLIAIFVVLAAKIVQSIQWLLRHLYGFLNKSYMALSREMEFHADEIAAHVTGADPLKSSLLRLPLATTGFQAALSYYDDKVNKNIKSANIYAEQSYTIEFLAQQDSIQIKNGVALVQIEDLKRFDQSKLVIEDQWSSHPSTEDRISRLDKLQIKSDEQSDAHARSLFTDFSKVEKKLTDHMFSLAGINQDSQSVSLQTFKKDFTSQFEKFSFPEIYNRYYDNKNPEYFDVDELNPLHNKDIKMHFFDQEWVNKIIEYNSRLSDYLQIKEINKKETGIKSFDYDGEKYSWKEAGKLAVTLENKLANLRKQILENDQNIYSYFLSLETMHSDEAKLKELYKEFYSFDQNYEKLMDCYHRLSERLQFLQHTTPHEQIKSNFSHISYLENVLKSNIKDLLQESNADDFIAEEQVEIFKKYLSREWRYFGNEHYYEDALNVLFNAMNSYNEVLSQRYFELKKNTLTYQYDLLKKQSS